MAHHRRVREFALALAALAAASAGPAPAEAAETGLSVLVDDGVERAATGGDLEYTVTIANHGTEDLEGLRIEQHLPKEFQNASSPGGAVDGDWIVWTADVPAEAETTLRATVRLSEDLPLGREAGTVVCAYLRDHGLPEDCESETAELTATPSEGPTLPWSWIAAVPAAAALAALVLRAVRSQPLYEGAHRKRGQPRHAAIGVLQRHIPSLSGLRTTQRR